MRTVQHTAIVTRSSDYKEHDKLVRLFTIDGGIVSAVAKGVKKAGAKLKFAVQPFAFCEYTLAVKNDFYTITGAVQIESLYALSHDPDLFFAASLVLESADCAVSSLPSPALFIYLLKLFQVLLYQGKCCYAAAALFLYRLLENAGHIDATRSFGLLKDLTPSSLPESGETTAYIPLLKKLAAIFEHRFGTKLATLCAMPQ